MEKQEYYQPELAKFVGLPPAIRRNILRSAALHQRENPDKGLHLDEVIVLIMVCEGWLDA